MKTSKKIGLLCLIFVSGILATLILAFVFLYVVHPVLAYSIIPPISQHHKVTHYTSGQYLEFEDGELFRDFTESLDFVDDGEIVDFFHADYWTRDNPFYGKACDYFILDLYFEELEYAQVKEFIENESAYSKPTWCGDYFCYNWFDADRGIAYAIAYRDESRIIRICMSTYREGVVYPSKFIGDTPGWWVD